MIGRTTEIAAKLREAEELLAECLPYLPAASGVEEDVEAFLNSGREGSK